MKKNYDIVCQDLCNRVGENSNFKLLMHSCCAPCSSACLERVAKYFKTDIFYYNPNITDGEEYNKRLIEQREFLLKAYDDKVKVISGNYNPQDFYQAVKGLENLKEGDSRCKICYYLRLEETAKTAKSLGYDYFCTTLSVSPYKNATWINEIGAELENKYGVKFLYSDFKKQNGYIRSIELSKNYSLYRQDYCGCEFSKNK